MQMTLFAVCGLAACCPNLGPPPTISGRILGPRRMNYGAQARMDDTANSFSYEYWPELCPSVLGSVLGPCKHRL